jgi:hypothetical protein
MEKSGFKDPIAVKEGKHKKSPWDFTCPDYDERSSCYVNAGSHFGVGHRQPVGHSGNPKTTSPVLPKGRVKTMEVDEVPVKNLPIEMEE